MRVGYAAFLDVLGFSALISSDQGSRIEKYLQCLKEVFDCDPGPGPVDYIVFSDSIILTTPRDDIEALQALLARCSALLCAMLAENIALRGAIAHGPYITEKTSRGTFVAGKAIIDAYQFEKAQDWIGIMLAPSVVQQVPNLNELCRYQEPHSPQSWWALLERLSWAAFIQPCLCIPFRGGDYEGFAVVPSGDDNSPAGLRDSLTAMLEQLQWLKSLAPDPHAQAKYARTFNWLGEIRRQWHGAAFRREQNPDWAFS